MKAQKQAPLIFRRIAFTYDVLRTTSSKKTHKQLADSFFQLFKYPILGGTGILPEFIGENQLPFCSPHVFYNNCGGTAVSHYEWQKKHISEPDEKFRDYLEKVFAESLVVGFELPPLFKKAFSKRHINYIDAIIHPIRYLPDTFYGFSSNNQAIESFLKAKSLPSRLFFHVAAQQKARYAPNILHNPLPGNNVLFVIGQTPFDKVLITPQKHFYSLLDFVDELDTFAQGHDMLIFQPHPYGTAENVTKYFANRKNCTALPSSTLPALNTYAWLSHPDITTCAGLNSSVLFEAIFFGKKAHNFIPFEYEFNHDKRSSQSKPVCWPIFKDCFSEDFWFEFVSSLTSSTYTPPPPLPVTVMPNLRLILRGSGSFDDAQSYTQCCKIGNLESDVYNLKKHIGLI